MKAIIAFVMEVSSFVALFAYDWRLGFIILIMMWARNLETTKNEE